MITWSLTAVVLLLRDKHGADGLVLLTIWKNTTRGILFFKLGLVQCKGEMVSILNWITASLMTKRRPGRRNTFNAIHKHFYRTSNP